MNVKIAAQTLSESVYSALKYIHESKQYKQFYSPEKTAEFCLVFNNAFNILNVRSQFSKRSYCKVALRDESYDSLKSHADKIIEYISNLKTVKNQSILESNRKTGFLGFVICLQNMFELWNVLKQLKLNYLLTFKLNQDHLETFFSALRSRGGFNNNPNAQQFEAAYKRLMIRHEIYASERGNCLINDIHILHVPSTCKKYSDPIYDESHDFGRLPIYNLIMIT